MARFSRLVLVFALLATLSGYAADADSKETSAGGDADLSKQPSRQSATDEMDRERRGQYAALEADLASGHRGAGRIGAAMGEQGRNIKLINA